MNKITLAIDDKAIDERLKTYLKAKAAKYLPFHLLESLLVMVMEFIVYRWSLRFAVVTFYFICAVISYALARRHLWTVTYSAILLTAIPIIHAILVKFYYQEEEQIF